MSDPPRPYKTLQIRTSPTFQQVTHKTDTGDYENLCCALWLGTGVWTFQRNLLSLVRFVMVTNYAFFYYKNIIKIILSLHSSSEFMFHCHITIIMYVQITYDSSVTVLLIIKSVQSVMSPSLFLSLCNEIFTTTQTIHGQILRYVQNYETLSGVKCQN